MGYDDYYAAERARQDEHRAYLWNLRRGIRDKYPDLYEWLCAEFAEVGHKSVGVFEWSKE